MSMMSAAVKSCHESLDYCKSRMVNPKASSHFSSPDLLALDMLKFLFYSRSLGKKNPIIVAMTRLKVSNAVIAIKIIPSNGTNSVIYWR